MKKKIVFLLNNYDFISNRAKKNLSLKKAYSYINKNEKVWPGFIAEKLKKNFNIKIEYPNTLKKYYESKNYIFVLKKKINNFKPNIIISFINDPQVNTLIKEYKKKSKNVVWASFSLNKKKIKELREAYDYFISDNDYLINIAKKEGLISFKLLTSTPNYTRLNKNNFYKRKNEIYFSGSFGGQFSYRREILEYLSKNLNIFSRVRNLSEKNIFLNYITSKLNLFFPSLTNYLFFKKILPLTSHLKYKNQKMLFGENMLKDMRKYKFCVNIHSDFDLNKSTNMRTYEVLSNGCLLFTDKNLDTIKHFKDKKHLIFFNSKDDLLKKINFYKTQTSISFKIASAGNKVFLNKFHSKKRIKEFKKIIYNILK